MSKVLGQLAIALGGMLFVVVMIMAVSQGVPILVAVFRAWVVMCVSSIVLAVFFRVFASVLYRFVAEQVMLQRGGGAAVAAAPEAAPVQTDEGKEESE